MAGLQAALGGSDRIIKHSCPVLARPLLPRWDQWICGGFVHRERFQGFQGCLLFRGLEGRKVTVSMYHGPGLLTGRFLSLLSINISRSRNFLGISVLWFHRLAISAFLCG